MKVAKLLILILFPFFLGTTTIILENGVEVGRFVQHEVLSGALPDVSSIHSREDAWKLHFLGFLP